MRKFTKLFATALVAAIIIIACQKEISSPQKENVFDTAAAKEWWYGTFRKSTGYTVVDYSSVFVPSAGYGAAAAKKYPNWKNGNSYKIGSLQIAEFPLVYNSRITVFPGSERLSKSEKIKIAEASLRKLLLVKKADNSVIVRTITLIPSADYAKQKNYDISNNTLQNPDSQFSGWLIIKDWKETIIGYWQIENGKRVKRMTIEKKLLNEKLAPQNVRIMMAEREVCDYV